MREPASNKTNRSKKTKKVRKCFAKAKPFLKKEKKMKKLVMMFSVIVIVGNLFAFAGGAGTELSPYQVSNVAELNDVRNYPSAYFIQTADIDLNVAPYNTGTGWQPIPKSHDTDYATKFTGVYDGNAYKVSNVYVNRPSAQQNGLFGILSYGEIKNVRVENADITGLVMSGAVIGKAEYGTIRECSSSGSVTGSNNFNGGIVGYIYEAYAYDCYSSAAIHGGQPGGFCGYINNTSGIKVIQNCYTTGAITGWQIEGFADAATGGTGFSYNFWDTETSGQSSSVVGTGKNTSEMKMQATYTNWDFVNIWGIDANINNGYPYLLHTPATSGSDYPSGQGTDIGGGTTILPTVDLDDAADQTIPALPNGSFVAQYQNVFSGTGIVDVTFTTPYAYGAIYQGGAWTSVMNSGGSILFESVNFDARGDVPIVLGDDNPLPVTLSSFSGTFTNGSSMLAWSTQSESNNLGWNVFRSETEEINSGLQINAVMIEGAGTTTEQTDYTFADSYETYANSSYWYWIESVDNSGATSLHGPARVDIPENEDDDSPELILDYGLAQNTPNPFNPSTTIAYKLSEEDATAAEIVILNAKGQTVKTFGNLQVNGTNSGSVTWDGMDSSGSAVSSGIYFYKLSSDSTQYVKKMIMIK